METKIWRAAIVASAWLILTKTEVSGQPSVADCVDVEPFPNPENCTTYYKCFLIGYYPIDDDHDTPRKMFALVNARCGTGNHYDIESKTCVEGACTDEYTTTTEIIPTTEIITTTEVITTTPSSTSLAPTTAPPKFTCTEVGIYPDPEACTVYFRCVLFNGNFIQYKFNCAPGFYFNRSTSLCTSGQCPSLTN